MTDNYLKLNDGKTEFLTLSSYQQLSKLQPKPSIEVGACTFAMSPSARNIGVVFESTMSIEDHVSAVCRACYFHIHNIGKVRYLLDVQTAKLLIQSPVLCRLDYCNSLLSGISNKTLSRLQRVQNSAARLITQIYTGNLPVPQRISYKVILLTHKAIYDEKSPNYLKDHISAHSPPRKLRSSDQHLLSQPNSKTTMGDKAFSVSAPKLWNSLPLELRSCESESSFRSQLKTLLFKTAYNTA